MAPFLIELQELRNKALNYIRSILNERGTGYEIIDPASYEDGLEDEVYKLPRATYLDKKLNYFEFPIVVININKNVLTFEGIDMGEYDDDKKFTEEEISTPTLCHIADLIHSLEK